MTPSICSASSIPRMTLLLVRSGIAFAGQHHAHGPLLGPAQVDVVGASFGHGQHDIRQVGLETRQYHLRLRVAEASVELDDLRAFRRQHETAVQNAAIVMGKRRASRSSGSRLHDLMHSGQFFRGNDRHRRVHTHAARIGAAVAIECALVILCGGHAVSLAVADERKQRTLGTRQAFFDEHGGAGIAERAVEAGTNSILCGFQVVGNDNALARCQAVRLDNDGSAQFANVSERFVQVREAAVTSRRNTVGLHEFLAVGFAALQQGSLSIGSERSHAASRKTSATPATKGASGPMTTRSIACSRTNASTASASSGFSPATF